MSHIVNVMLFGDVTVTYYNNLFQSLLLFDVEYFINYPLENIWTHCEVKGRYKNKMQNWLSFLLSFHSSMAKMVHLQKVKIFQKTIEHQRYLLHWTSKGCCHKNLHWKCFPSPSHNPVLPWASLQNCFPTNFGKLTFSYF